MWPAMATWENTTDVPYNSSCSEANPPAVPVEDEQIFNRELRYVGDEVAAVAADSEETAMAALQLIRVEYEELPAVYDPLEAMKPEAPRGPSLFPGQQHRRNGQTSHGGHGPGVCAERCGD